MEYAPILISLLVGTLFGAWRGFISGAKFGSAATVDLLIEQRYLRIKNIDGKQEFVHFNDE